jgi:4-hydroxy-4-methyl-2-oxoglutarate aldolase
VIDGGVRDVDALERLSFPAFSTGIVLRGATKEKAGAIGVPTRVGDVDVGAGDWIVGDRDGVVLIRAAALEDVLTAGRGREAKEAAMFEELRGGATTVELLGLDTSPIDRSPS